MTALHDLTGQSFGRLTVIYLSASVEMPSGGTKIKWHCRCTCGGEKQVQGNHLKSGVAQSCGCLHKERAAKSSVRHGGRYTKLYGVWTQMRQRCENPNNKRYADWGGRGIKVCKRWHDFAKFRRDMEPTYREGLSLDRIDNDDDYKPSNCRWATMAEQNKNRRAFD